MFRTLPHPGAFVRHLLPGVIFAVALHGSTARLHAETVAVAAGDVSILKEMLSAAGAPDAQDKTDFDARLKRISDPVLQSKTLEAIRDLEKAAALKPRLVEIEAAVKAVKGTVSFEKGGPQWLRDLVGDEPMRVFDRLTGIDLNDRQSPHDKTYKRNDSITDEWLKRLAGLPDLVTLSLANTGIKGPGLKLVGTLKNLEELNLTLTPVTDPWLENLRDLTKLRVLGLASAQCNGEGYRFLGKLTHLENANFHFTPVNDAGLAGISIVTSLSRLEIVHTHFTDAGAKDLAKLVNLERLQIGSREATGAAVEPLVGLRNLRELDLHDGQATIEGVRNASRIPSLRVLRVYGGALKDESIGSIASLKNLEQLIVSGAGITDAGLEHLAGLPHLKNLEIKGCKASDAAIAKLREAIPGLEIVR